MDSTKKTYDVLVTGGGGFLGERICAQLRSENLKVASIARNKYARLDELGVDQYQCDLSKAIDLDIYPQAIIHTAAKAGVWGKYHDFYHANVLATKNLYEWAIKQNIGCFIHTSSPSVVSQDKDLCGVDESTPYPEKYFCAYAETKALAEIFLLDQNDDLKKIILRPHLIFGPGDPHILPRLQARAHRLRQIGDGENMVDVIYVENAALAHILAYKNQAAIVDKSIFFLGQEHPVKLWPFINELLTRTGYPPVTKKISLNKAKILGGIMESIFRFIPGQEPPITVFSAIQLGRSHYFNHQRSLKILGDYQQISLKKYGV